MSATTARTTTRTRPSTRARTPIWKCGGQNVYISPTADIPNGYRPGHRYSSLVQRLLEGVEPWERDLNPIETFYDLKEPLRAIVTPNNGRKPVWGIHVGHKARRPELSPFVHGDGELEFTRSLTVELAGSPSQPKIVRIYPGEYVPPLPWQVSAWDADGGMEACREFWSGHSYIYERALIQRGTQTNTIPNWYK